MCVKSLQSCPTLCDPMDCSPPRLLCLWNSPGKNTGVGCHFLLQGIFPTQGLNSCVSCIGRQVLYQMSHQRSPKLSYCRLRIRLHLVTKKIGRQLDLEEATPFILPKASHSTSSLVKSNWLSHGKKNFKAEIKFPLVVSYNRIHSCIRCGPSYFHELI